MLTVWLPWPFRGIDENPTSPHLVVTFSSMLCGTMQYMLWYLFGCNRAKTRLVAVSQVRRVEKKRQRADDNVYRFLLNYLLLFMLFLSRSMIDPFK